MEVSAIIQVAIGAVVLFLGRRIAVFAGAAGFLIGLGLVESIAPQSSPWLVLIIAAVVGVVAAILVGTVKGFVQIVGGVIGALAGAGIMLKLTGLLGLPAGVLDWVLPIAGGVIGFFLMVRFFNWGIVALACLAGASLIAGSLGDLSKTLGNPPIPVIVGVVLFVVGFVYQMRASKS